MKNPVFADVRLSKYLAVSRVVSTNSAFLLSINDASKKHSDETKIGIKRTLRDSVTMSHFAKSARAEMATKSLPIIQ